MMTAILVFQLVNFGLAIGVLVNQRRMQMHLSVLGSRIFRNTRSVLDKDPCEPDPSK